MRRNKKQVSSESSSGEDSDDSGGNGRARERERERKSRWVFHTVTIADDSANANANANANEMQIQMQLQIASQLWFLLGQAKEDQNKTTKPTRQSSEQKVHLRWYVALQLVQCFADAFTCANDNDTLEATFIEPLLIL